MAESNTRTQEVSNIKIEGTEREKEVLKTNRDGSKEVVIDPLLYHNPLRFILRDDQMNTKIFAMYKKAQNSYWTREEVDLSEDIDHWKKKLNDNERFFISRILAFFASSDGIVNENLALRFYGDVQLPEARMFYGFQIAMENIHSENYSALIKSYIEKEDDQKRLFEAILQINTIKKKAEWALKWIEDKNSSFALRLIAFAAVEGIFFSGSFCAIYWLKKR